MERYSVKALVILLFLFLLTSCIKLEPYFFVLKGNNDFRKGDYQSANVEYLKALNYEDYSSWISYNLGTVYNALGENDAAQEEWERVIFSRSRELEYLSSFNLGTVYYKRGRYEDALGAFKNALILVPDSIQAKVNLEYTLQKLQVQTRDQEQKTSPVRSGAGYSQEINRILEYVQRKEENIWQSPDRVDSPKGVLDW